MSQRDQAEQSSAGAAEGGAAGDPLARAGRWSAARQSIECGVAHVFGVARTEIGRSTRGRARAALARQAAMYLAHVALRMSYTDVGRAFARDRTTVAHACAVVEDRRDDPGFDRAMELLEIAVCSPLASREPSNANFN